MGSSPPNSSTRTRLPSSSAKRVTARDRRSNSSAHRRAPQLQQRAAHLARASLHDLGAAPKRRRAALGVGGVGAQRRGGGLDARQRQRVVADERATAPASAAPRAAPSARRAGDWRFGAPNRRRATARGPTMLTCSIRSKNRSTSTERDAQLPAFVAALPTAGDSAGGSWCAPSAAAARRLAQRRRGVARQACARSRCRARGPRARARSWRGAAPAPRPPQPRSASPAATLRSRDSRPWQYQAVTSSPTDAAAPFMACTLRLAMSRPSRASAGRRQHAVELAQPIAHGRVVFGAVALVDAGRREAHGGSGKRVGDGRFAALEPRKHVAQQLAHRGSAVGSPSRIRALCWPTTSARSG